MLVLVLPAVIVRRRKRKNGGRSEGVEKEENNCGVNCVNFAVDKAIFQLAQLLLLSVSFIVMGAKWFQLTELDDKISIRIFLYLHVSLRIYDPTQVFLLILVPQRILGPENVVELAPSNHIRTIV